jgi:hypothetical protein
MPVTPLDVATALPTVRKGIGCGGKRQRDFIVCHAMSLVIRAQSAYHAWMKKHLSWRLHYEHLVRRGFRNYVLFCTSDPIWTA